MTITKYEHACLVLTKGNERLLIDPGAFTHSLPDLTNVQAIVITHVHPDHVDEDKVNRVLQQNAGTQVFAPQEVADAFPHLPVQTVTAGEVRQAGSFSLGFTGGTHAIIHPSKPAFQNIGVLVDNGALYYPGDSFAAPGRAVAVLAAPAAAPWLKISEAMDFIANVKAKQVFPTHDAVLSAEGQAIHDRHLGMTAEETDGTYRRLAPGESIEVA